MRFLCLLTFNRQKLTALLIINIFLYESSLQKNRIYRKKYSAETLYFVTFKSYIGRIKTRKFHVIVIVLEKQSYIFTGLFATANLILSIIFSYPDNLLNYTLRCYEYISGDQYFIVISVNSYLLLWGKQFIKQLDTNIS